jgi:hypothetical protein
VDDVGADGGVPSGCGRPGGGGEAATFPKIVHGPRGILGGSSGNPGVPGPDSPQLSSLGESRIAADMFA